MTPIAVTILLTEATRTGSSAVTRRFDRGSAIPSAKLAISPRASNATPASAWTTAGGGATVAQAVRGRPRTRAKNRIARSLVTFERTPTGVEGARPKQRGFCHEDHLNRSTCSLRGRIRRRTGRDAD